MTEWSKVARLGRVLERGVGSNPTVCKGSNLTIAFAFLAQLEERQTFDLVATGSIPVDGFRLVILKITIPYGVTA